MDKEDLKTTIRETMREEFRAYGFTVRDTSEIQKDIIYLRNFRLGCQKCVDYILKGTISIAVGSTLYIMWEAFKSSVTGQ